MYQAPPPNAGYYPPPQQQARPDLFAWFSAVDTDRSGKIKPKELQQVRYICTTLLPMSTIF